MKESEILRLKFIRSLHKNYRSAYLEELALLERKERYSGNENADDEDLNFEDSAVEIWTEVISKSGNRSFIKTTDLCEFGED